MRAGQYGHNAPSPTAGPDLWTALVTHPRWITRGHPELSGFTFSDVVEMWTRGPDPTLHLLVPLRDFASCTG